MSCIKRTTSAAGLIAGKTAYGKMVIPGTPIFITADSVSVVDGSIGSGTVDNTRREDDVYLQVNEVSGNPGFDVRFTFTTDQTVSKFLFDGRYEGNTGHRKKWEVFNNNTSVWDEFNSDTDDLGSDTTDESQVYLFSDLPGALADYKNVSDEIIIRLIHTSNGSTSHDVFFDYLAIQIGQYNITAAETFQTLDDLEEEDNKNVTLSGVNGTMTVTNKGIYNIEFSTSFSGDIMTLYKVHLYINGVKELDAGLQRAIGAAADIGSGSFTDQHHLDAGDVLTIRVTSDVTGALLSIHILNWNITRIE